MTRRLRILLIGNYPPLEERLRQNQDLELLVQNDLAVAASQLDAGWFHLVIVQLRKMTDTIDTERFTFCMNLPQHVPRIFLGPSKLDDMGVVVRDALTSLDPGPSALAFATMSDDLEKISEYVRKAIKKATAINRNLSIKNFELDALASTIMPGQESSRWTDELEDLFQMLFPDCSEIRVRPLQHLPTSKGYYATLWVEPSSLIVSEQYPMLVKCGRREIIEEMRVAYSQFLFRLTAVQPAACALTSHFGAIALPAPVEQPGHLDDFASFYFRMGGKTKRIERAIDHLFEGTSARWRNQTDAPAEYTDKELAYFFMNRWKISERRLLDRAALSTAIAELAKVRAARSLQLEINETSLVFSLAGHTYKEYPNPLSLLSDKKRSIFAASPSHPRLCITHGDFRGMNLCVDADNITWIEGLDNLDWRPAVTDVAGLEALIKFHCLGGCSETLDLRNLYGFERVSLEPDSFESEMKTLNGLADMNKALKVIRHLRMRWGRSLSSAEMPEYYACLFFFALREILSDNFTSNQPSDVRKLHALLSAAMIGYRLEKWGDKWNGWPEPKQAAGW